MINFKKSFRSGKIALSLHLDVSDGATAEVINASLRGLLFSSDIDKEADFNKFDNVFLKYFSNNTDISLDKVIIFIDDIIFDPQIKMIGIRILKILYKCFYSSQLNGQSLYGAKLLNILKKTFSFSSFIAELDPIAISCTNIPISLLVEKKAGYDHKNIDEKNWILDLVKDIPTLEKSCQNKLCDALGVAMLRTVCSTFGLRGESILKQKYLGIIEKTNLCCIAMLCTPKEILTRIVDNKYSKRIVSKILKINAVFVGQDNVNNLLYLVKKIGAKKVFFNQIFDIEGPKLLITIYASQINLQKISEVLLLSGKINSLYWNESQSENLQKKIVAIPYGDGKILKSCKVIEWYFEDKIVKVEPEKSNLVFLEKKTKHSADKINKNIIKYWRIWRKIKLN